MLDKLSKRILKYMNKNGDPPSETYYDFQDGLDKLAKAVSSDTESVRSAVRSLHEKDYIEYVRDNHREAHAFYLDHKGLHYKEFSRLAFCEFMAKSVLTPIIVAFITTLITLLLSA